MTVSYSLEQTVYNFFLCTGTTRVSFENGTANFSDLAISHSGNGYVIKYRIVLPTTHQITSPVPTSAHTVKERALGFTFAYNLSMVFESAPLHPQPSVVVFDEVNGQQVGKQLCYFKNDMVLFVFCITL